MKAGFANCGHNFWWREFKFASFLYAHTSASGHFPGFWQRQSAVPSRALTCLSLSP